MYVKYVKKTYTSLRYVFLIKTLGKKVSIIK